MPQELDAALTALQDAVSHHDGLGALFRHVFDVRRNVDPWFVDGVPLRQAGTEGKGVPVVDLYNETSFRKQFLLGTLEYEPSDLLRASQAHLSLADCFRSLVRALQSERGGALQLAMIEARIGTSPFGERAEEVGERLALNACRAFFRLVGKGPNGASNQVKFVRDMESLAGVNRAVSLIRDGDGNAISREDHSLLVSHVRPIAS